jgi:alpha-beta hydrolase superfamily lysophospholipase
MENLFIEGAQGYKLSLALFPVEKPKAVLQIVHGMQEHKERYYAFGEFLASHGYAVVVSDMRGHGVDAPELGHIADKGGENILLDDQRAIY